MTSQFLLNFFLTLDTIGALIGVGSVTFAEIFYTTAASDGVIDHHERKYLRHIYHGLTYGMALVLFSGLALVILEYLIPNAPQSALTGPFWALETLTIAVLLFAELLSHKQSPWWLGSGAILASWWMILLIDLGFFSAYNFTEIIFVAVIATAVAICGLQLLRFILKPHRAS
jgi:hypothetical protein